MDYNELVRKLRSHNGWALNETLDQAADAIEELQKQLQKSEADNVNLTGWLAEEHAKNCPHYIRNVHDRGDDSFCDVLMTELPRVDPCADCVHYPPSSTDGKPCCACDQANPLTNCHEPKEETE